MGYTNSPLTAYTKLSPNHSGQRTHAIDRITPHCVVGQCTAESLGDWFAKSSTQASSNYGIDKDGRVGLYVEEKNRSYSILNRLPYPHYILHHKAYNCYSAPATATKQYRLSTGFNELDHVAVQAYSSHGHYDKELAKFFKRFKNIRRYSHSQAKCCDN